MNIAFGYYLNIFDLYGKRDVFIIFNESNSKPTVNEVEALSKLIEAELEKDPSGTTLQETIENSGLECVDFGVQVKSFGLKSPSLEEHFQKADIKKKNNRIDSQAVACNGVPIFDGYGGIMTTDDAIRLEAMWEKSENYKRNDSSLSSNPPKISLEQQIQSVSNRPAKTRCHDNVPVKDTLSER